MPSPYSLRLCCMAAAMAPALTEPTVHPPLQTTSVSTFTNGLSSQPPVYKNSDTEGKETSINFSKRSANLKNLNSSLTNFLVSNKNNVSLPTSSVNNKINSLRRRHTTIIKITRVVGSPTGLLNKTMLNGSSVKNDASTELNQSKNMGYNISASSTSEVHLKSKFLNSNSDELSKFSSDNSFKTNSNKPQTLNPPNNCPREENKNHFSNDDQIEPETITVGANGNSSLDEIQNRYKSMNSRLTRLMCRVNRLQSRQAVSHIKQQIGGFIHHQQTQPKSEIGRTRRQSLASVSSSAELKAKLLKNTDVKTLSTSALVNLVRKLQNSEELSLNQHLSKSSQSVNGLDEDFCRGIKKTSDHFQMNASHLKYELDSDATESSSGGESADELEPEDPAHKFNLLIRESAEWRWSVCRSAIAARWTWLQAQISDLEYRIRQQGEIHRQIRATKGAVTLESVTPLNDSRLKNKSRKSSHPTTDTTTQAVECSTHSISKSSTIESHPICSAGQALNGVVADKLRSHIQTDNSDSSNTSQPGVNTQDPNDSTCVAARCRPLKGYRKRRLLTMKGLHNFSRKASRPSSVKCQCTDLSLTSSTGCCGICSGRVSHLKCVDSELMSLAERVALLDHSYHSVLSIKPVDVPRSIYFESLLKSGRWQSKSPSKQKHLNDRKQKTFQMKDHLKKKFNYKLNNGSSSSMAISSKIRTKYENSQLKQSTPPRSRPDTNGHSTFKMKKRKHVNSLGTMKCKRRKFSPGSPSGFSKNVLRSRRNSKVLPLDHSQSLREQQEQLRRRRGESDYDINNIVIPYSMASSTRVEKLHYKEIITPKWRIVEEAGDVPPDAVQSPSDIDKDPEFVQDEDLVEDLNNDAIAQRHLVCEKSERKRYMMAASSFDQKRGRGSMRTDGIKSDVPCTPLQLSPNSVSPPVTPQLPATPTPITTPSLTAIALSDSSNSAFGDDDIRRPHSSKNAKTDLELTHLTLRNSEDEAPTASPASNASSSRNSCYLDRVNTVYEDSGVSGWPDRQFPLTVPEYDQLISQSSDGYQTFYTPRPLPAQPSCNSTISTEEGSYLGLDLDDDNAEDHDPTENHDFESSNDPEWTVINKQATHNSNLVMKISKHR